MRKSHFLVWQFNTKWSRFYDLEKINAYEKLDTSSEFVRRRAPAARPKQRTPPFRLRWRTRSPAMRTVSAAGARHPPGCHRTHEALRWDMECLLNCLYKSCTCGEEHVALRRSEVRGLHWKHLCLPIGTQRTSNSVGSYCSQRSTTSTCRWRAHLLRWRHHIVMCTQMVFRIQTRPRRCHNLVKTSYELHYIM